MRNWLSHCIACLPIPSVVSTSAPQENQFLVTQLCRKKTMLKYTEMSLFVDYYSLVIYASFGSLSILISGHFQVPKTLTFKTRPKPYFLKCGLVNESNKLLSYQRLRTKPRFETEAWAIRQWPIDQLS